MDGYGCRSVCSVTRFWKQSEFVGCSCVLVWRGCTGRQMMESLIMNAVYFGFQGALCRCAFVLFR